MSETIDLLSENLKNSITSLKKAKPKIAVLGDVILDEYVIGYPERISREAPVLILEYKDNYYRLGGAANAAINAAHLGAEVCLIGTVGEDDAASVMTDICKKNNIEPELLTLSNKPTTLKTRILSTNQGSNLSHAGTSSTQQVLRIDKLSRKTVSKEEGLSLLDRIRAVSEDVDVILLSDYTLGVLSEEVIREVINLNIKVVVDPSTAFDRFNGAFLITPNQPDTEKFLEKEVGFDSQNDLIQVRKDLKEKLPNVDSFLVTRGANGMALFESSSTQLVPAFNKAEVFDVTGAGDTVSACVSVSLAAGLDLPMCAALGNLAASIVVRKLGTETTNTDEMIVAANALEELKAERFIL
ncbi:MAG: PfkB family carbohydrate kinase [Candidatus Caenarcaniphilales bacterium]|nr:PfkB family carbohydrate kinase [Candidatus Caenarcaniphilales bacterium]